MKSLWTAAVLLSAAATTTAASEEAIVLKRDEAPIKVITVYARQALVRREAAFEAHGAGPVRVTLARLPARIRDDSVRVRAEQGLLLLGSRVVARPIAEANQGALADLRADLAKLDVERKSVDDAAWVAEWTIEHVKAAEKAEATEAASWVKATPEQLTAFVAWAEKTLEHALEERRARHAERDKIDARRAELQAKIQELERAAGFEKSIDVELEASAAGRYRLQVEYVTDGASWAPFYDFRADTEAKAIDITYLGVVRQDTGEDWRDVQLALSTARPELGARPPDLPAWFVGMRSRREYDEYSRAEPRGRPAAAAAPAAPPPAEKGADSFKEGKELTAVVEERGATVAFQIGTPETIPSDGKEKRTTIGRQSFKTENRYFSAPKVAPFAYLRSTVTSAFAYPMLAGEANVFFGPDFVGRARTDLVPPGEKFDIYLGVDERVKIERKVEKRFHDTKGLISTDVRERYEYRITAKNTRDVPIQLTLVDQVPVSQNEDVRIEDVTFSLEPTEKDEKTGERRWSVGLGPKAETSVLLGFTVRFPQKKEGDVVGLER